MRVLKVPSLLRLASLLLLLAVPIVGLEVMVATNSPWWHAPYRAIQVCCSFVFLLVLPVIFLIGRGKHWALSIVFVLGFLWVLASAGFALYAQNPLLGFFSVFVVVFWLVAYQWIKHELNRSYFNPRVYWFQGMPQSVPGLVCVINSKGREDRFQVSRIDKEGCFLFSINKQIEEAVAGKAIEMIFSFRDKQVKCKGFAIRTLPKNSGLGMKFFFESSDVKKEVGDFVEVLRGEGHE
ncbi:MAG: hypothetical protein A3K03_07270 [Bdellovibrionales bacterium RIFOXYD1_FULL_44_7]|nr:MAG: hypothetical protein A3K03_07270 [Bdellovibrionales bacterium RIFOXYD1_FULL_44_7]